MRLFVKCGEPNSYQPTIKVSRGLKKKSEEVDAFPSLAKFLKKNYPKGALVSDQPFEGAYKVQMVSNGYDESYVHGAEICHDGLEQFGFITEGSIYIKKVQG